jgi:hypothetical protein
MAHHVVNERCHSFQDRIHNAVALLECPQSHSPGVSDQLGGAVLFDRGIDAGLPVREGSVQGSIDTPASRAISSIRGVCRTQTSNDSFAGIADELA